MSEINIIFRSLVSYQQIQRVELFLIKTHLFHNGVDPILVLDLSSKKKINISLILPFQSFKWFISIYTCMAETFLTLVDCSYSEGGMNWGIIELNVGKDILIFNHLVFAKINVQFSFFFSGSKPNIITRNRINKYVL